MGQHRALRLSSSARGVDDCRQVVGSNPAGLPFGLGVEMFRTLLCDVAHLHTSAGEGGQVTIELEVVHDHDLLDVGLWKDGNDLVQLLVG